MNFGFRGLAGGLCLTLAGCSFDGSGLTLAAGDDDDDIPGDADAAVAAQPDAAMPPIPEDPPGLVRSKPAPAGMAMDALLGEWSGAKFYQFGIGQRAQGEATPSYDNSMGVRFASMHDAEWIYFAFQVTDNIASSGAQNIWDDDGVALYLDASADATGPYGWDDHEIMVNAAGVWQDLAQGAAPVELAGDLAPPGAANYTIEIQIRKSSLGAGNSLPATLGFDLALTDNDGMGAAGYDAFGLWFKSTRPACTGCCSGWARPEPWCDTTLLGSLLLE